MAAAASYTSSLPNKTVACASFNPSSFPSSSLHFPYPLSSFLTSSLSTSHALDCPASVLRSATNRRVPRILAVVEEEPIAATEPEEEASEEDGNGGLSGGPELQLQTSKLYVCNLPRSCDIAELLEVFKPYGTVQSVEVSRNTETGLSRGSGYVTMSSIPEAKAAIAALDGSDLGGREMHVRFSVDLFSRKKDTGALNSAMKNIVFESPYKAYVGNLAWSVRPEDLREHFSQFGNVVSTRVLYDRKAGKSRVYGFISFSSAAELEAAKSSSGKEFRGRTLLVREIFKKE
ncbi:28 kDa ribonucleoprotein, chloroplastic [Magnolia sinica]|uniref:28 kDa ribonucleoprotein, chloroplastic n=1 Tax=Magnolia sinica TaxID=86752 RepID=UPI00265B06C2|nr:28 kDa ribonucleoprotein, chloroplastic [Magnolia sinica]